MTPTIISPSDLSQRTREILDRVQGGELAVVASGEEERIVLLDAQAEIAVTRRHALET